MTKGSLIETLVGGYLKESSMQPEQATHYYQEVLAPVQRSFFSGDNVTVMIIIGVAALVILTLFILSHIFARGKSNDSITITQIEADAKVKVAQLEGEAKIKVAELDAMAETRCAELGAGNIATAE